jgi:hypothetical protein
LFNFKKNIMGQKIIKGLLMAASYLFVDYNAGTFGAASWVIASCFLLGYYVKNWWFPSASEDGLFDWKDVASALILAISIGVPEAVDQFIINGSIVWKEMVLAVTTIVFTYFTSTFFPNNAANK